MILSCRLTTAVAALLALTAAIDRPTLARAQPAAFSDERLLLEGTGLDDALLDKFAAGKPLEGDERAALITALAATRQIAVPDLGRFARAPAKPGDLLDPEARYRLWRLRGKLKSVAAESLSDDDVARLYADVDDMPPDDPRRKIYRCEIELDDNRGPLLAYVTQLPKKLPAADGTVRVGLEGVILKNAGPADAPRPIAAAARLAWYPPTLLGDLGVDHGLYDDVRRETRELKRERELFYQLLAKLKAADANELFARTAQTDELNTVIALFNEPETMQGKLIALTGVARRAVAVVVDDADIQERYGIKKFYEVAIYTPDSQQNPLIFNVSELPPGFPEGESIRVPARIAGTYLTGFYYKRDATSDEQLRGIKPKLQKAPLLIGRSVVQLASPVQNDDSVEWIFSGLIIAALVVLGWGAWSLVRSERRSREILQKRMAPPAGTSLNDASVEYSAGPDFSRLRETPDDDDERPRHGGGK